MTRLDDQKGGLKLLIGLITVVFVLGACAPIPQKENKANTNENASLSEENMMEEDVMMEEDSTEVVEEDAMMEEEDEVDDPGAETGVDDEVMVDDGDGTDSETAEEVNEKNVALSAVSGSDIFGSVALTAMDDKTRAVVSLTTLSGKTLLSVHPVFIHEGTCASLGTSRQVLNYVTNGRSVTMVGVPLARITADGNVAIAVQAATNDSTIVACGNVPN